jgi:hypothetical protein
MAGASSENTATYRADDTSNNAARPFSSVSGSGGHPGMWRSTGTVVSTPPTQAWLPANIPPFRALETTALSLEEIAAATGFDGPATLRERFRREVGVSPSAYRRSFGRAPIPV